jgi:hypothetical protein
MESTILESARKILNLRIAETTHSAIATTLHDDGNPVTVKLSFVIPISP